MKVEEAIYLLPRREWYSHCTKAWLKPYSICDASLSTSARRSFAPLQKSRQNHRCCVWIEALSGKPIFAAESRILWGLWFLYNPGRRVLYFFWFVVDVRLKLKLEKVTKTVRKRELIGRVDGKIFRSKEYTNSFFLFFVFFFFFFLS